MVGIYVFQNEMVSSREVKVFKLGVEASDQCLVLSSDFKDHVLKVMAEWKMDQSLIGKSHYYK